MVQEVDAAPSPEQKVKDQEVVFWSARHSCFTDRLYVKDKSRRTSELRRDLIKAICKSSNGIATMSTDLRKWAATLQSEAKPLFDHLSDVELSSLAWTFEHIYLAIKESHAWQDPARALLDIKVSLSADHLSRSKLLSTLQNTWTFMFIIQRSVRSCLCGAQFVPSCFLPDVTDSERQQQLGANPAFNFDAYDAQHENTAMLAPAWLEARWYRQLVIPEQTASMSASQAAQSLAPFSPVTPMPPVPIPMPAPQTLVSSGITSPQSMAEQGYVNPLEVLLDRTIPARPPRSLAHTRIGIRAQRRYGITPSMWRARWGSA